MVQLEQAEYDKLVLQLEEAQQAHIYWEMAYGTLETKFQLEIKRLEDAIKAVNSFPSPDTQRFLDLENKNMKLKHALREITEAIVDYVNEQHPEVTTHPRFYDLKYQLNSLYTL